MDPSTPTVNKGKQPLAAAPSSSLRVMTIRRQRAISNPLAGESPDEIAEHTPGASMFTPARRPPRALIFPSRPAYHSAVAKEPSAGEPSAGEPSAKEPSAEEPSAGEPSAEEPEASEQNTRRNDKALDDLDTDSSPNDSISQFRIRCLQVFNEAEDITMDPRLQNNKVLLSAVMTARMASLNAAIVIEEEYSKERRKIRRAEAFSTGQPSARSPSPSR